MSHSNPPNPNWKIPSDVAKRNCYCISEFAQVTTVDVAQDVFLPPRPLPRCGLFSTLQMILRVDRASRSQRSQIQSEWVLQFCRQLWLGKQKWHTNWVHTVMQAQVNHEKTSKDGVALVFEVYYDFPWFSDVQNVSHQPREYEPASSALLRSIASSWKQRCNGLSRLCFEMYEHFLNGDPGPGFLGKNMEKYNVSFWVSIQSCSFISLLWRFIDMKTWIYRVVVNQWISKLGRLGQWATFVNESAPASMNQKCLGFFSTSGINMHQPFFEFTGISIMQLKLE